MQFYWFLPMEMHDETIFGRKLTQKWCIFAWMQIIREEKTPKRNPSFVSPALALWISFGVLFSSAFCHCHHSNIGLDVDMHTLSSIFYSFIFPFDVISKPFLTATKPIQQYFSVVFVIQIQQYYNDALNTFEYNQVK